MGRIVKFAQSVGVIGLLTGCTAGGLSGFPAAQSLPKGEQVGIREMLAAHPGQRACTEYDPATNSCASLISSRISGDTLISTEVAAAQGFGGGTSQIEVTTRSTIDGDRVCLSASDISVGAGSQDKQAAAFVVDVTRGLVAEVGGVCGTYYRSGEGYVVSSAGADGAPFMQGDIPFQFVSGTPTLRAQ